MAKLEHRIAQIDDVDILVNNAVFGIPGKFVQISLHDQLKMIDVHVIASVRLSFAVLPGMLARRQGAIINVASIGAFIPKGEDTTYCATKAYLTTFSIALSDELRGTNVWVQALCPGFTYTEFHDRPEYDAYNVRAAVPKSLWLPAEDVVKESLDSLRKARIICIPGLKTRLIVTLARMGLRSAILGMLAKRLGRPS